MFNEGGHSFSTEKYYYTTENYFAISSARDEKGEKTVLKYIWLRGKMNEKERIFDKTGFPQQMVWRILILRKLQDFMLNSIFKYIGKQWVN